MRNGISLQKLPCSTDFRNRYQQRQNPRRLHADRKHYQQVKTFGRADEEVWSKGASTLIRPHITIHWYVLQSKVVRICLTAVCS